MKSFLYYDATDLGTGERSNIIQINAQSPQAADAILQRCYNLNVLDKFGKVSFSGATYTHSTKTIAKTGAFERYALANSTRIIIVSGTGATAGEYVVATRVGDDSITLSTSIGAGADGQTDIVGYIIGGRTAVRIERTNVCLTAGIPGEGNNEAGTGLNRGVSPSRMIPGLSYEFGIDAA